MSDPFAKEIYRALGGFPWLIQTLTGATDEELARWHAANCHATTKAERWLCARAMLADFIPSIGDELITMFMHGFVVPASPMMLPEQERSVLFLWAPMLGRWPNGVLTQVMLAVKHGARVIDTSGEFDFMNWRTMIEFNEAMIVDFLIVPEIQ